MEQVAPDASLPDALIIAGPTCSGKSALAMELAARHGGVVINADSMQVYRDLPILTARPSPADERAVPHALYGVRDVTEPGSAAWWRAAALHAMADAHAAGRRPILCGGTGLYLSALTQGIVDIPEPTAEARAEARALLAADGAATLHARLAATDPDTAAGLRPSDGQRLARAWEVWRSTGRGLASWQQTGTPALGWRFRLVLLDPARDMLRAAIAQRFQAMLDAGALNEVAALRDRALDPALPGMRAHGVVELMAYLRHEVTLAEAGQRTVLATGQYTKRQATWFRHRRIADPCETHTIHARYTGLAQFSQREWRELLHFLKLPP